MKKEKWKIAILISLVTIFVLFLAGMIFWMVEFSRGIPMPEFDDQKESVVSPMSENQAGEKQLGNEQIGVTSLEKNTDQDNKAPWKNYFNSEIGISFSYPSTMEIIFDGPVETDNPEEAEAGEEGYFWHRIVLKDSESFEQPELVLEIDADEIDLVSFDKEYDVAETEDGRVEILSLDDGAVVSESSKNDGMTILSTLPIDSINEVSYAPRFSFKEGGRDLSSDFQLILKSMKFFELSE